MQIHVVNRLVDDHARKLYAGYGMSCPVCALRPKSRGSVRSSSRDPANPPRIGPNFLAEEADVPIPLAGAARPPGLRLAATERRPVPAEAALCYSKT